MVDLVVFDMAGTTVHDGDLVNLSLREALLKHGVDVDRDAVNRVMGWPKPMAIRALAGAHPAASRDVEAFVAAVYADFEQTMIEVCRTDPDVRAMDGADAVFRALQAMDVRIALDTGFNRRVANAVLARLGWHDCPGLIDTVVTSDEVRQGRPAPDLVFQAMARLGLADASRVVKVGDTPADLEEGSSAGCGLVVGVTCGSHTREELSASPHTHLIDRLGDLVAIVRGHSARKLTGQRHA